MTSNSPPPELDVLIVGAGFAGLYALHKLRGQGLHVHVVEAGDGIGGTWHWNRYPGARCDVESLYYSYSFDDDLQQKWEWSERYATQPEILRYVQHVAERFDLMRDIELQTKVESAHWDDAGDRWRVRVDRGVEYDTRFLLMATGCLSSRNRPDFPGLDDFAGDCFHTGEWPQEEPDLSGDRVGIIGTGSSGIQAIPPLAERAKHLTVFQRTANYTVPANNHPLAPETVREVKADYPRFRKMGNGFGPILEPNMQSAVQTSPEERERELEARWTRGGLGFLTSFIDLLFNPDSNEIACDFVRDKIRNAVDDPEVAEILSPHVVFGCKRPCIDTGYFETFNRPNVTLVDVSKEPIERISEHGVVVAGREHPIDTLVLATGFDAMTGTLLKIDIRGRDGRTLQDKWQAGPRTFLGLQTEGFPNLFTITGPGSPSVLSNMLNAIEQHVDWIADCLQSMRQQGKTRIEAELDAENAWVEHTNEIAQQTLYWNCNSWYLGANIPGKPRVFMPYIGMPTYQEKLDQVLDGGYEGFALR